jgi:hypothetical protein
MMNCWDVMATMSAAGVWPVRGGVAISCSISASAMNSTPSSDEPNVFDGADYCPSGSGQEFGKPAFGSRPHHCRSKIIDGVLKAGFLARPTVGMVAPLAEIRLSDSLL